MCGISKPSVNSILSHHTEAFKAEPNCQLFTCLWPWNITDDLQNNRRLFYATSSFVHHLKAIGVLKLELQPGNAQIGSKLEIFCPIIILIALNRESLPPYGAMIVISLNEVHVWWKVGCLLGYWIIVGLSFCSILAGYYSFPQDPDFHWRWVCSGWYLKSLSPLRKPTLVESILPSQEWLTYWGSSWCPSWHSRVRSTLIVGYRRCQHGLPSRWNFKYNNIYIFSLWALVLGRSWLGIRGFLWSCHVQLKMPKFSVKY